MRSHIPGRIHPTRLERRIRHELSIMHKTGVASEWLVTMSLKKDWVMRWAFPSLNMAPTIDIDYVIDHYLTSSSQWFVAP